MKIHDVEQNTPEWHALRVGIPTASCFDKIITPTGKESTQYDKYANLLIAELMTGKQADMEQTEWMIRGSEMEEEAANYYAFNQDIELVKVGFVTDNNHTMGCSPDRFIGTVGILEIKVPAPHTHVEYLIKRKIDQKYMPQIQGQLFITGRKWCDIISYHPEMPAVIIRVARDESYIAALYNLLVKFSKEMDSRKAVLRGMGYLNA